MSFEIDICKRFTVRFAKESMRTAHIMNRYSDGNAANKTRPFRRVFMEAQNL